MNKSRFERFVDAWITAQSFPLDSPDDDPANWAIQLVLSWHKKPEKVWRLIVAVFEREISDEVEGMVAAGPLEDLLSNWGPEYIDRVEQLALKDERFRRSLKGVWGRNRMDPMVWARLQALVHKDRQDET